MTITPLYTEAEIADEITLWKAALKALTLAEEYTHVTADGGRTSTRRAQIPQIEARLQTLQALRVQNALGGGPQLIQGRVRRG